jgi:hypothetical protein
VVLEIVLLLKFEDFEDAVLHEAARHAGANYIVARNLSDFKDSKLPVFEPREFINNIESLKIEGEQGA